MLIAGTVSLSTVDYPKKTAYTIFTSGCNFRCGYCHNPEFVVSTLTPLDPAAVIRDIQSRKRLLDAIVVTGGEPTIQYDLPNFLTELRKIGLPIKLDTNGTRPDVLAQLYQTQSIDYVAMDLKSDLAQYPTITNTRVQIHDIKQSINLIMQSDIPYEFRTTIVPGHIAPRELMEILKLIRGAKKYILQQFNPNKCLDNLYQDMVPYTMRMVEELATLAVLYVDQVEIRNI